MRISDDMFSLLIVLASFSMVSPPPMFSGNSYQGVSYVHRHEAHIGHHQLLSVRARYSQNQNNNGLPRKWDIGICAIT